MDVRLAQKLSDDNTINVYPKYTDYNGPQTNTDPNFQVQFDRVEPKPNATLPQVANNRGLLVTDNFYPYGGDECKRDTMTRTTTKCIAKSKSLFKHICEIYLFIQLHGQLAFNMKIIQH